MENLFTSIRTSFKNRVTSPLLGSFIIAWILWNRNIIYSALFLNQELIMTKYGLLKNEYLIILLNEHYWLIYTLLLPTLSILIIYYLIPYIDEIIYKKDIKNKNKKHDIKLEEEDAWEDKKILLNKKKKSNFLEIQALEKEYKNFYEGHIQAEELYIKEREEKHINRKQEYSNIKNYQIFISIMEYIHSNGLEYKEERNGMNKTQKEYCYDHHLLEKDLITNKVFFTEKCHYIFNIHQQNNL